MERVAQTHPRGMGHLQMPPRSEAHKALSKEPDPSQRCPFIQGCQCLLESHTLTHAHMFSPALVLPLSNVHTQPHLLTRILSHSLKLALDTFILQHSPAEKTTGGRSVCMRETERHRVFAFKYDCACECS